MTLLRGLPSTTATGKPRIIALDSLRGLAALAVVLFHLNLALEGNPHNGRLHAIFQHVPLRYVLEGHFAVILFFVLSGFALSISIEKNFHYGIYLVRRLCRLMIPCIAAVLFAAAMYLLVSPQPIPELNRWFNTTMWMEPLTPGLVFRHILMTGSQTDSSLDNVLWSLVVELRISLVFPLLYFLVKGRTWIAVVAALIIQFFFSWLVTRGGNYPPQYNRNLVEALENFCYYVPFFVAGILARNHMEAIHRRIANLHPILALIMLTLAFQFMDTRSDIVKGLKAVLIICLCVNVPFLNRVLSIPLFAWLGRISFSLYLVHIIVLASLFHLFYGKLGYNLLCAMVIVVSLIVGWIFYLLVENPSIQLGRRLSAKKKPPVSLVGTSS
ncbi:acyltransferase family protein [Acidicapsa ligni]|uniref:acyltransferase family protein n=1 Tax=Acidicapsa ligni TaxID=542300 RepID=UPI0021E07D2D|nr:acyltransferase [Acidicapsa ligni]